MGRNTVAILMAEPLQYLLNTLKYILWKKYVLVIHKILRLFVNTWIVEDKHYLLNRDNLTQPIQMQLYQKQKTFSELFFPIFKIFIKLETFAKKR